MNESVNFCRKPSAGTSLPPSHRVPASPSATPWQARRELRPASPRRRVAVSPRQCFLPLLVSGILAVSAAAYGQHQHEGDFIIGISGGAAPQLKFEFDEHILAGEETLPLEPSGSPAIAGWLSSEPGFEALEANEPDEDFYMLGAGADIRLVGLGLDPGLFVRAATLGSPVRISPSPTLGELLLGGEGLHTHAIWHIDSSAPGFDPLQTSWAGTFKFVDTGTTGYGESEPFTLHFAAVPEPASACLLLAGGLWLMRRRSTAIA